MSMIPTFKKELEHEAQTTKKMLERIPDDKYDWQPHPKSMTIRQLSSHIAELPEWITLSLTTDGLDFATTPYEPKHVDNTADLMKNYEASLANGFSELKEENASKLGETWVLSNGDMVLNSSTKAEVIRMTLNQIVHHRAQLGVYLRLLNVPIPGSYGPSADEQGF